MERDAILKFFDVRELVCPHVYKKWGARALDFLDDGLLAALAFVRAGLGTPLYVNNWHKGGDYSQRGLRCNLCDLVQAKTHQRVPYLTAHVQGKAVDFTAGPTSAEAVRVWIQANSDRLPVRVRLEEGTSWVHMDVRQHAGNANVLFFKP